MTDAFEPGDASPRILDATLLGALPEVNRRLAEHYSDEAVTKRVAELEAEAEELRKAREGGI